MSGLWVLAMLNVEVGKYRFTAKGHADYAKRGQDIVCSASSAIALHTIELLKEYSELSTTVETGNVEVTIHEPNESTNTIVKVYERTMKQLEKQYPKHIKVHK